MEGNTFLGTNISPQKGTFEDDFSFPKVGYVSSLEGKFFFFFRGSVTYAIPIEPESDGTPLPFPLQKASSASQGDPSVWICVPNFSKGMGFRGPP